MGCVLDVVRVEASGGSLALHSQVTLYNDLRQTAVEARKMPNLTEFPTLFADAWVVNFYSRCY